MAGVSDTGPNHLQGKLVTVSRRPVYKNPDRGLMVSTARNYVRQRPCTGVCKECGKPGHEAFECKDEYDYNGMRCVPPAMLYKDKLVDRTGAVQ